MICKNNHFCKVDPNHLRDGHALCNICIGSGGEQLVVAALESLGLEYVSQYKLPGKTLRYDFATGIDGLDTIIEWDGPQHFQFTKHFHQTEDGFKQSQYRDCEKTRDAVDLGCKMIRIDYTMGSKSVDQIAEFIFLALEMDERLLVSNADMYQWLVNY